MFMFEPAQTVYRLAYAQFQAGSFYNESWTVTDPDR